MANRVQLLCEDRLTDRFLRRLCERCNVRVLESDVAPAGQGAASRWVRDRYPHRVKLLRARRHQRELGLIVTESLKDHAGFRKLWEDGTAEAGTIKRAVARWKVGTVACPSLSDAYGEAVRVGL